MIKRQTDTGDPRWENHRISMSMPYHSPFMFVCLSAVMVLFTTDISLAADPPRKSSELVNKGNRLLSDGYFGQALAAYDKALEKAPSSAEIAYDRGIALYRLGRFAEAETAFQDALATTLPELEAKAKYNLGRCAHAEAMAEQQKDMQQAINGLSRAIGFYNDALQLRPDDADAHHNSSMAQRLQAYLKKKLALAKKQKPPPSSQPGDKKQSDDSQKGQDQKQDGDQQSGDRQDKNQDQQNNKQPSKSKPEPSTQPGKEKQTASQPSSRPAPEPESKSTSKPSAEKTTQPAAVASQPTTQPEGEANVMRRISIEQAMRMLQEARDAEQKRREMKHLMKLRSQGRIKVDKDW